MPLHPFLPPPGSNRPASGHLFAGKGELAGRQQLPLVGEAEQPALHLDLAVGGGELVPLFGSPRVVSLNEAFVDGEDPIDQSLPEDKTLILRELVRSGD
jgi:hypothetical protein